MSADTSLRYTSAPARRAQLLQHVEGQGFCTIAELAAAFDVSEMTIRRDVQQFIADRRLRGVHGGVSSLRRHAVLGSDFAARAEQYQDAKRSIARRAAQLIEPERAIGIDAGTTTLELANSLDRCPAHTVVSASLPVMAALSREGFPALVGLGGALHRRTQSFAGQGTVEAIADVRLDLFFLAASGIAEQGVYCANEFDAVVKRAMIEAADRIVLLSDSSKFHAPAMVRICALDRLDGMVIDDGATAEQLALLERNVDDLMVVPARPESRPEKDQAS